MVKKLIYYFYLTPDFKANVANRINFECLRRYAHVFDCADIYLSLNDTSNTDLIQEAEHMFVSMPFNGNISFKVVENTKYCESKIIKEEILDKVGTLDCLVFFAHAKGYKSVFDNRNDSENVKKWIVGCYFLSLEYISEMERFIGDCTEYSFSAYGSFPVFYPDGKIKESELNEWDKIFPGNIKYNWYYSGTFFWLNTVKFYNYMHVFSPELPKLDNRYFGERMLGNIFPIDRNGFGHNERSLYPCNFYNKGVVDSSLDFILEGEEHDRFNEFYGGIMASI